jgi:hypothetical protein
MAKRSPFKLSPETAIIAIVLGLAAFYSMKELLSDVS